MFDGAPAPVFEQERVCLKCGAWLWVASGDVTPAAPRVLEMERLVDAVLAGIAATGAFQRDFQRESSAA
jgi:hypothetical protein